MVAFLKRSEDLDEAEGGKKQLKVVKPPKTVDFLKRSEDLDEAEGGKKQLKVGIRFKCPPLK